MCTWLQSRHRRSAATAAHLIVGRHRRFDDVTVARRRRPLELVALLTARFRLPATTKTDYKTVLEGAWICLAAVTDHDFANGVSGWLISAMAQVTPH